MTWLMFIAVVIFYLSVGCRYSDIEKHNGRYQFFFLVGELVGVNTGENGFSFDAYIIGAKIIQ